MLTADIRLRPADGDVLGRLAVYPEGSACHERESRFGRQLYRAGAFLPRGPHRPVTAEEAALLDGCNGHGDRNHVIGVERARDDLVAALRGARRDDGQIAPGLVGKPPFSELAAELAPRWRLTGALLPLGYGRTPPGFRTVTVDGRTGRFIGLHIDDLDAAPLPRRTDSTTRLCVNLGRCDRYLLFVNVGVPRMVELLAAADTVTDYAALRSTPLIHAFLRRFPAWPVLRLAIRPGEAYIAPTENMIHDGATDGMSTQDEQVTLRGLLDPV